MNVYEEITARFLAEIEKGILPWRRPWSVGTKNNWAYSHVTGKPYSYLNTLLCGSGEFLTFATAKKEGGFIKKGAKSKRIFAPAIFTPADQKDLPEDEQDSVFYFRRINVFHIDDTEGIEAKEYKAPQLFEGAKPVEAAERAIDNYIIASGVTLNVTLEARDAHYSPLSDCVVCPSKERFEDINEYYSTLFHELAHSTGNEKRLDRQFSKFGSGAYSKEELVAEFATAIIMQKLGLETPRTWQNSTAYLSSWAKKFKEDNKIILQAASKAEKAANMILGVA